MLQTPPPSQLEGCNVGGLKWRLRRVGRLSPKQFRNLARRRVFASSCDGIWVCRNHVEQVEYVELSVCSYMICMVNHFTLQLQLETCIFKRDLGKILIEMGNWVFLPDVA